MVGCNAKSARLLVVGLSLVLGACLGSGRSPLVVDERDGSVDAMGDAFVDAPGDSSLDGGLDSSLDGGLDSSLDGGLDSSLDGGLDSSLDGGLDSSLDGGLDSSLDGGLDSSFDGGPDSSVDSSMDSGLDGGLVCASPLGRCGAVCVDPRFDPSNCGGCGVVCGDGFACGASLCEPICSGGLLRCDDACVDARFDPSNCGGCGILCGADEVCNMAICSPTCGDGTVRCGDVCVDPLVDPDNCGGCGVICALEEVCMAGLCDFSCVGGALECGGSCVDPLANPSHCGGCGIVCGPGEACIGGGCGMRPITDIDGDTIADFDETSITMRDTDMDGTPDYLDLDTDGDGIPDSVEAGDADVISPPIDSDGDATPDFRDLDSDNDGLSDEVELGLGTDPTLADSDGDGETDALENAGGTDPLDPTSCIICDGGFVFELPFEGTPRTRTLTFDPRLQKADIFFLVDTTGSMGGTIDGLQSSLDSMVAAIRLEIDDAAFGVARFDDFPLSPHGDPSCRGEMDVPFRLEQRITTVDASIRAGVESLDMPLHCGADGPESQIEGIFQGATGAGFLAPGGGVWTPAFDGMAGFDPDAGHGLIGGAGFRDGAVPIFIVATDQTFHRRWDDVTVLPDRMSFCGQAMTDGCDAYLASSFSASPDGQPKSRATTLTALEAISAKVFGLAVGSGGGGQDARVELAAFAVATGAWVEPDGAGLCDTGVDGATRPAEDYDPDGAGPSPTRPLCPLVFETRSDGSGVASGVVSAIQDLVRVLPFSTIHTEPVDNPATPTVDETLFFQRGVPVSAVPAAGCGLPSITDRLPLPAGDGVFDSFEDVCPGTSVTFQIIAENMFVMPTCIDQIFRFDIVVIGDDLTVADSRVVAVRVPGDTSLCM